MMEKTSGRKILGLKFEGAETVDTQKVTTAFFPVGESEVELLESTSPDGPVAKFIEKKGTGFQHVAFRVANIDEALQELKDKGNTAHRPATQNRRRRCQNCFPPPESNWRRTR